MCHHMIINDTHCNTLLSYLRDHIYRCGGPSAIVMVKVHHDAGTPCRQPVAMDDCISDISAGFDTVDYVILLDRLSKSFGITDSALFWFQSLLTDLLNFLLYFASLGFWVLPVHLSCGLPQGLVLTLLLFILYTSDPPGVVGPLGVSSYQYAGDTQTYLRGLVLLWLSIF